MLVLYARDDANRRITIVTSGPLTLAEILANIDRQVREKTCVRRQLLPPVSDNYFCRRRVSKGVSPTTWRHSVVVVGRSVAV